MQHAKECGACNRCLRELGNYRRREPCDERYGLELLRRATLEGDPQAWECVQHCFSGIVRGWQRDSVAP